MANIDTLEKTCSFISLYPIVPSQPFLLNSIKLIFLVKNPKTKQKHFVILNDSDVRVQQRPHLATSRHCSVGHYSCHGSGRPPGGATDAGAVTSSPAAGDADQQFGSEKEVGTRGLWTNYWKLGTRGGTGRG